MFDSAHSRAEDGPVATLAQKVGQLLWCGFGPGTALPPAFAARVRAGEVGAAILFRDNVGSVEELIALTSDLHAAAPPALPLLVTVDQEGGRVQRVRAPATVWPPMIRVADPEAVGRALGAELAVLGFDVDFAPVLDVHTNPENPIIGDRAFATSADEVIRRAGAFARGLAAAGLLACGKHFPGHGDTTTDSHLALPRIDHDLARLRAVELAPFRAVPLPMVMTAHVVFAALDPERPATLSRRVIGDLLRGELGYRGVVVSDDLEMKAIADHFGIAEAVERGLVAGCDAFLLCHIEALQLEAHAALVRAAERSPVVRARVDEAAARVAALKAGHRFRAPVSAAEARAVLGRAEHQALAEEVLA
jgi:beta-N-acetylhexosaminidase